MVVMVREPLPQPMHDAGALIGRVLLGAIFVWEGFAKATAPTGTIGYFAQLGLPLPSLAYVVSVAVELVVGLLFVVGFLGRSSAMILAIWCIATAIAGHRNFSDPDMVIHFYKNVSMCGGFIYAALLGPGLYSS